MLSFLFNIFERKRSCTFAKVNARLSFNPLFMKSVNRVQLMGNVAADPELRSTKSGKNLAAFAVATNAEWKDANGEKQKRTDFHRVIAWQGLGVNCDKYLKKGSAVFVEGKIHNHSYEDKEKQRRTLTEITAEDVHFIQGRKPNEAVAV
jgi:single-strand DNA-binding protein